MFRSVLSLGLRLFPVFHDTDRSHQEPELSGSGFIRPVHNRVNAGSPELHIVLSERSLYRILRIGDIFELVFRKVRKIRSKLNLTQHHDASLSRKTIRFDNGSRALISTIRKISRILVRFHIGARLSGIFRLLFIILVRLIRHCRRFRNRVILSCASFRKSIGRHGRSFLSSCLRGFCICLRRRCSCNFR